MCKCKVCILNKTVKILLHKAIRPQIMFQTYQNMNIHTILKHKSNSHQVDDLERQLRLATKEVQQAEDELDSMRNKCTMAEIDSLNQKTETETLKSRIVCMEHELESYKSMCKEQELLQIEKERLVTFKLHKSSIFDK